MERLIKTLAGFGKATKNNILGLAKVRNGFNPRPARQGFRWLQNPQRVAIFRELPNRRCGLV